MELQHKFYYCIIFRIKGIPYANTTWLKNGKPLIMSEGQFLEYKIEYPAYIEGKSGSKLTSQWQTTLIYHTFSVGYFEIHKETHTNIGRYTLVASNALGTVEKSINVTFTQGNYQHHSIRH